MKGIDVDSKLLDEARRHIFTVDADTYRQMTGRSLSDIEMVLIFGCSNQVNDGHNSGPMNTSALALTQLYKLMREEGIEYAIGLKFEFNQNDASTGKFEAYAYATGLKQKSFER